MALFRHDAIITHQKAFRAVIYHIINQCQSRHPRTHPADAKYPLGAQRTQAKRACIHNLTSLDV